MRKSFNFEKDRIADQIRDWESAVVLGTVNGQTQLISTTDEHSTQRLLENVQLTPVPGGAAA